MRAVVQCPVLLVAMSAMLSACGDGAPQITFKSAQEKSCYESTLASVTDSSISLVRGNDGNFVEVKRTNGFVDDLKPSPVFNQCMASANTGTPVDPVSGDISVSLTAEEQAIWDGLSDARKRDALAFKQKGGHLRDFK